jgi:hypothetical protein
MAAGGLTGRVLIRALLSLISLSIFANAVIGWATARAVGSRFDGTFFSPMCAQVADLASGSAQRRAQPFLPHAPIHGGVWTQSRVRNGCLTPCRSKFHYGSAIPLCETHRVSSGTNCLLGNCTFVRATFASKQLPHAVLLAHKGPRGLYTGQWLPAFSQHGFSVRCVRAPCKRPASSASALRISLSKQSVTTRKALKSSVVSSCRTRELSNCAVTPLGN